MKTVFTIIPDPKLKEKPVIIREDNPETETAVIIPPDEEEPKDTAPPEPGKKPKPS